MSYSLKCKRLICDLCGKFIKRAYDSYIPFGCYNPEDPEPYDPTDMCKQCSKKDESKWADWFKRGNRYGNWAKSKSEIRAAKKFGLTWIFQDSITVNGKNIMYRYVTNEEFINANKGVREK